MNTSTSSTRLHHPPDVAFFTCHLPMNPRSLFRDASGKVTGPTAQRKFNKSNPNWRQHHSFTIRGTPSLPSWGHLSFTSANPKPRWRADCSLDHEMHRRFLGPRCCKSDSRCLQSLTDSTRWWRACGQHAGLSVETVCWWKAVHWKVGKKLEILAKYSQIWVKKEAITETHEVTLGLDLTRKRENLEDFWPTDIGVQTGVQTGVQRAKLSKLSRAARWCFDQLQCQNTSAVADFQKSKMPWVYCLDLSPGHWLITESNLMNAEDC